MMLLTVFSGLAIFIACLGLYGLATFMTERRTKETGIRKALGASTLQLVVLFLRDFGVLLAVSFVVAVPAAWYLTNMWMQSFAYRAPVGAGLFVVGAGLVTLVALASVLHQPVKAAMADPRPGAAVRVGSD